VVELFAGVLLACRTYHVNCLDMSELSVHTSDR
jgi:hypothetical protein